MTSNSPLSIVKIDFSHMCLWEDVLAYSLSFSNKLLVLLYNLEQLFSKYGPETLRPFGDSALGS